jgi:hypothetical protein
MLTPQSVNFKEVFGTEIYECIVNPYWTVTEFIENVRPMLSQHFRINQNDIDIIVPEEDLRGMPAEMGEALIESNTVLATTWGQNLEYVSCYVRRKNFRYRQIDEIMRQRRQRQQEQEMYECPICYETQRTLVSMYVCSHTICSQCHDGCYNSGCMTCPLCRANSNSVYNMV